MSIKRGDIYYVEKYPTSGSEQQPGRPAIIVSNDKCNENSDVFEVVYLTTQPKNDLPTHVTIRSATKISTALCEQISSVCYGRLGNYIGSATDDELALIDIALMTSLGLSAPKKTETSQTWGGEVQKLKNYVAELEAKNKELIADLVGHATRLAETEEKIKGYEDRLYRADVKNEVLRELYEQSAVRLSKAVTDNV